MLKSLLGDEMLYKSWVHVLHITIIFDHQQIVLETIINHSYLFVINKDDNRHVFQYCNRLFKVETFMANTMSTDCLRKEWIQSYF